MDPGNAAALLHRVHGGGDLLLGQPQADVSCRPLVRVWPVLRNRGVPGHEFGCVAAQRFALDWPVSASRTHSRPSRAHGHRRLTNLVQSSQVRETRVLDRRVGEE